MQMSIHDKEVATLPEGYIYPGTYAVQQAADNNDQKLDPEETYQLEDDDILVGFKILQEKYAKQWLCENKDYRCFLMPRVYGLQFSKDDIPLRNGQFQDMATKLRSLLMNAATDAKRTVIAGILNVDANHYVNFFISRNADGSVSIMILCPSAEIEPRAKAKKEFRYAQLIVAMLDETYHRKIRVWNFGVTQQTEEFDCGFWSLQNLDDFLSGKELFQETRFGELRSRSDQLTVNGSLDKTLVLETGRYCYPLKVLEQSQRIRQLWAARLRQEKELYYYSLKDEPTLTDAVAHAVLQDPYNYTANVQKQSSNDCTDTIRGALFGEFSQLPYLGYRENCFVRNLTLPDDETIEEYTKGFRQVIADGCIIDGVTYTAEDLERRVGPFEKLIFGFILESLRSCHKEAFEKEFKEFARTYSHDKLIEDPNAIYADFFNAEPMREVIELYDKQTKKDLVEFLQKKFGKQINKCIEGVRAERMRENNEKALGDQAMLPDTKKANLTTNEGNHRLGSALADVRAAQQNAKRAISEQEKQPPTQGLNLEQVRRVAKKATASSTKKNLHALNKLGEECLALSSSTKALGIALIALGAALTILCVLITAISLGAISTVFLAPLGGFGTKVGIGGTVSGTTMLLAGIAVLATENLTENADSTFSMGYR